MLQPVNRAVDCLSTRSRWQPHCKAVVCVNAARGVGDVALGPASHALPRSAEEIEAQAAEEGLTGWLDQLRVTAARGGEHHPTGFHGVRQSPSSDLARSPCFKYQATFRSTHPTTGRRGPKVNMGTYPTAPQAALVLARAHAAEAAAVSAVPPSSEAEELAQRLVSELHVRVSEQSLNAIRALLLMRDQPELTRDQAIASTQAHRRCVYQNLELLEKLGALKQLGAAGYRRCRSCHGTADRCP